MIGDPSRDDPEPARESHESAATLRLRPQRPRVTRLSRKTLAAGAAIVLVAVAGSALWALRTNRDRSPAPEELYSTDRHATADGLAGLPRDYAGIPRPVPRLGPPLPGDLGRPILSAQGQPAPVAPAVDPDAQRRAQELEAARVSQLFAATNVREQPALSVRPAPTDDVAQVQAAQPSTDEAFAQNAQDRKLAFVNAAVDRRTTSPDRLAPPASPYVVQAGSVIPAALVTGIRSDLPGQIIAQVTENVYDSPNGQSLLIPQGSRLIGLYDSQVAFGQSRVLLVWTRLILPNGRGIVLERQPGADPGGYAGLEDEVDNHWGALFKAAIFSTLLAVGTEVGSSGEESEILQALRQSAGDTLSQTGQQIVRRNLDIQPTLTIRPGFPVRVIVNRDLVLEPYSS